MRETNFVITCDFDWEPHGEDDDGTTPADCFTYAEARKRAVKHQREFPEHKTFRVWKRTKPIRVAK